ncbi:hypothetical protein ASE35_19165 [Lysobacter sp. Root916]|uniref:S8 family serine peptidase n=1 Tax=Lysobacter sp. Root916 TaxID=1736606 RepID=UPI00070CE6D5|nr:S8 family serine peptidase [Lysobacter sp. Root916]KRD30229.1 hypothetical protein ASE35_19165 [Lysobacter sp. Root916]
MEVRKVSKHRARLVALIAVMALGVAGAVGAAPPTELLPTGAQSSGDPNRVWIRFPRGQKAQFKAQLQQSVKALRATASAKGLSVAALTEGKTHHEFDQLDSVVMTLSPQVLSSLRNNKNLVIERDMPRYPLAEYVPFGIPRVQAPDTVATGANGNGVKVCVIDSGLRSNHEDFAGISITGYADSGRTWNTDDCGHGTHVAGTIAAVGGNGKGVTGVSPGKVSLHIVKYFDGPSCSFSFSSDLIAAADKCAQAGAKVINMSLGGAGQSSAESAAFANLYNQGIVLVAAAGNDGTSTKSYPASYASVISVAALDSNNAKAAFSQFNDGVDIAAPGQDVSSTYPKRGTPISVVGGGSYDTLPMANSASATVAAALIDGGRCASAGSWSGKVVLCERGDNTTLEKVTNVKSGGGRAIILYNNVSDPFAYSTGLKDPSTLTGVAVSQASGQALRGLVGQTVTVNPTYVYGVDNYAVLSGTSMASPHVAGVAALMLSAKPSATPAEVREALLSTALDLGPAGRDNEFGYGLVQAFEAVDALLAGSNPNPPGAQTYSNAADVNIPDNNATGASSTITVSGRTGNAPSTAKVSVNVQHPFRGDVIVDLIAPDGTVYNLFNRPNVNDGTDHVIITDRVIDLSSETLNGAWKLRAADRAPQDVGYINSWSVTF